MPKTLDISKNNKSLHIRLKDVSEASQSKKLYLKKICKLILKNGKNYKFLRDFYFDKNAHGVMVVFPIVYSANYPFICSIGQFNIILYLQYRSIQYYPFICSIGQFNIILLSAV